MGIKDIITSPTFTIVKEYYGDLNLFHIDAYRLDGTKEDVSYIFDYYKNGVTVIEWPEFISDYLPYSYIQLYIVRTGDESRSIEFSFVNKENMEKVVNEYGQNIST